MSFIEVLKATRIHRTLTALAAIMVPVAFASNLHKDIYFLALTCIFVYCASGILNAKKDNDYKLPKYYKIVIGVFLILGLIVSFKNLIITATYFSWIGLGLFYNTAARYILFGDVTILSITHHTLPTISSSFILGLDIRLIVILSLVMFVTFWFIIHMKNLKDSKEDKDRGYKTLSSHVENGEIKTKLLFDISFLCMFVAYFILGLSRTYLYILITVLIAKIMISYFMDVTEHETALNIMRLMVILFLGALIIDQTDNKQIILISAIIGVSYLLFLLYDIISSRTGATA